MSFLYRVSGLSHTGRVGVLDILLLHIEEAI